MPKADLIKHFSPFIFIFFVLGMPLGAQDEMQIRLTGKVIDAISEAPVDFATVYIQNTTIATDTDENGNFNLTIGDIDTSILIITRLGYKEAQIALKDFTLNDVIELNIGLSPETSDVEIVVTETKIESGGMVREAVDQLKLLPTTSGNFESILPHIALGTTSGTGGELTSQYNVRGGNYDENLVYVNDFEIFRQQLVRSSQQEGLSFPNIDLIRDLSFSSGGFESKYGDKLSSVLDIRYKRPDSLRASAEVSFLGGSAHIEGSIKSKKGGPGKLRFLVGSRYKTTQYLLGSLDTKGEFTPNFTDIQTYITYDINKDFQIGLIGNYNRSIYEFEPDTRNTALGLIDFALQLTTVFEGRERDDFTNAMGGLSLTYIPDRQKNPLFMKLLASRYSSEENERFDILGFYNLAQVETGLGSSDFGEVVGILGTGIQHRYARNFLQQDITNIEYKGGVEFGSDKSGVSKSNFVQWSLKWKNESIDDFINEWERLDSAGFSLPYDPFAVRLQNVLKTSNVIESNRFEGYLQNTLTSDIIDVRELKLSYGVRFNYWDLNKEFIVSPRAQLLFKPLKGKANKSYKLAAGLYAQPAFYRELRRPDGTINLGLKAQKSFQLVGGFTHDFYIGRTNPKPFKFIAEAYYKRLWDMVSYEIDNVRIRYSGENNAKGYIAGIDMRINGEFVPGAESWINLSLLQARESLENVQHKKREEGELEGADTEFVPRPTDQFVTLAIFFQDYLPKNENFKVHLNFVLGTGLPFGVQGNNEIFRNTFRYDAYHRVDLGFSFRLWNDSWRKRRQKSFFRFSRNAWASLEVFNLLQVSNESSNTWIKTIYNTQFAIPNHLTSRRINLRVRIDI